MSEKSFGEAKARKNCYSSDIKKFKEQGVKLILVQAEMSTKTQEACKKAGIVAFHGLTPETVSEAREKIAQEREANIKEKE